jgi:hypothetical protein
MWIPTCVAVVLEAPRKSLEPAGEELINTAVGLQRVAMDGRADSADSGGESVQKASWVRILEGDPVMHNYSYGHYTYCVVDPPIPGWELTAILVDTLAICRAGFGAITAQSSASLMCTHLHTQNGFICGKL